MIAKYVIQRIDTKQFYYAKKTRGWLYRGLPWDHEDRWTDNFHDARIYLRKSDASMTITEQGLSREKMLIRSCQLILEPTSEENAEFLDSELN